MILQKKRSTTNSIPFLDSHRVFFEKNGSSIAQKGPQNYFSLKYISGLWGLVPHPQHPQPQRSRGNCRQTPHSHNYSHQNSISTPPKINIEPENDGLKGYVLRFHVNLPGCIRNGMGFAVTWVPGVLLIGVLCKTPSSWTLPT